MPLAPRVMEPGGEKSQIASPDATMMTSVAHAHRRQPSSSTSVPSRRNGMEFPIRCAQPPCSHGARKMLTSPSSVCGLMP